MTPSDVFDEWLSWAKNLRRQPREIVCTSRSSHAIDKDKSMGVVFFASGGALFATWDFKEVRALNVGLANRYLRTRCSYLTSARWDRRGFTWRRAVSIQNMVTRSGSNLHKEPIIEHKFVEAFWMVGWARLNFQVQYACRLISDTKAGSFNATVPRMLSSISTAPLIEHVKQGPLGCLRNSTWNPGKPNGTGFGCHNT